MQIVPIVLNCLCYTVYQEVKTMMIGEKIRKFRTKKPFKNAISTSNTALRAWYQELNNFKSGKIARENTMRGGIPTRP